MDPTSCPYLRLLLRTSPYSLGLRPSPPDHHDAAELVSGDVQEQVMKLMYLIFTDQAKCQEAVNQCQAKFGIADDCFIGINKTTIRWNKRVKISLLRV